MSRAGVRPPQARAPWRRARGLVGPAVGGSSPVADDRAPADVRAAPLPTYSLVARTRPERSRPCAPFVDELASFGGRTAVVADGAEITYTQLAAQVEERAAALGGGRRLVLIAGSNDLEILVTYLAALHGGHVAWLVPDASGPQAASLLSAYEPDVVASMDGAGLTIDERHEGSRHDLHPDLALLLGTSGSTGTPRLVRLSHENLQSNAESIAQYLDITESERAVTSLPIHYCYGLSVVNSHLLRGAQLLLSDHSVADPEFWSLLREGGGTSFAGVPHTFDLLDRIGFEDFDLPTLRYVTQAGGRLGPPAVRRYAELGARKGWRLVVMYGQTEATARIAYLPPDLAADNPGTIGVPIPGGSFEIRPVPEEDDPDVGELVYRGPNVMLGYADSAEDLADGRVVHELCTGDLGRCAPSGLYEITGRRSRFLKLFGLRIDLQQVEQILDDAGVSAVCAGTDDLLVVAVKPGSDEPEPVERLLAERLGIPVGSILVRHYETIPLLPSGKPDYAAIARAPEPDEEEAGLASSRRLPAGTGATSVAAVFEEVLHREGVSDTDTFSGLGGDSLSYVEMSIALEEVLGKVPAGWPEMPVGELALLERDVEHDRSRMARMETNVVLRAAAIVLVVAGHMTALWPAGGAHLLLSVAGYNFARFQLASMDAPRRFGRSIGTIARVAVPTSAWIALQVLLAGGFSVGAILLVNNYTGAPAHTDGRWWYWYLEALVQILLVLTLLFSIPAVRRLHRSRPFLFVISLLALALVLRFELVTFGADYNRIFQPHTVVWFFLLGWAVQRAVSTPQRALVSVLVLVSVPGFFGQPIRETIIVAGMLSLLWIPAVVVPRPLSRVIGVVAAASMYIYLTHWQAWPPLTDVLPLGFALVATVAAGIGAWFIVERLTVTALRHPAFRSVRGPGHALIARARSGIPRSRWTPALTARSNPYATGTSPIVRPGS